MAAAIGIDLGSKKAVMGVVKRKGIEVVLNEGSNRATPVCIGYQQQERIIGDAVMTQKMRNFKNSVLFPTRFLGLNSQCTAQIEIEKRYVTHKIVSQPNNKIAFEVVQAGNTHTFNVEQIIAFYLQKLHDHYVKDDVTTKDIVVTIPSYASNTERQSLVDAAEIAGLKCLRVINESTAIAYNYGFFRKADLDKDVERVVAFVDMGHSKTTITIAAFKQQESRIIVHKSDRNLGGRDCDYQVMQKLCDEFQAKFGDDPRESARCRLRLFDTIEKARKLLSGDTEASINIDYLLNEEDMNRKLTREEFETLIDPQVRQFTALLRATLEASGLQPDQIHFVELIGDCTRTPIIQSICKQVFEKEELARTLNALECVARGASLNSAMITPHFTVQSFIMNDYNNLPVSLNYQFKTEDGAEKEMKAYPDFFQVGQKFPLVQKLDFNNKEGSLALTVNYSENSGLMAGLPTSIAQYDIGQGKRTRADDPCAKTKLSIRVKNNINQIPELELVQMSEMWEEEEKIPVKTAPKPVPAPQKEEDKKDGDATTPAAEPTVAEEQKYEIKTRKKERTSEVPFKTISHAIPPDLKLQFKNLEAQLMSEDRKILDLKEAKYVLESFTYELKNGIAQYGNYELYVDPTLKGAFEENLLATVEWIYGEGENAPLEDQRARLEGLQSIGNPVKQRWRFRSDFVDYVAMYQKFESQSIIRMNETFHLTEDQRTQITEKCALAQQYIMKIQSEVDSKPKHEDISVTLVELEKKQKAVEAEVNAILNTPEPVKEEEKKAEEPATDAKPAEGEAEKPAADAEMQDEQKPEGQ